MHKETKAAEFAKDPTRSLRSIFQEAHEQLSRGKGVPHDQFWREVEQLRGRKEQSSERAKESRQQLN